jgi:WD40 repeat protein
VEVAACTSWWDVPDDHIGRSAGRRIKRVAFSPDGALIAGVAYRHIWIWDADSGAPVAAINDVAVEAAGFSPDGTRIAAGDEDGRVRVYNARTGTCERVLPARKEWSSAVAFSRAGTEIVVVGRPPFGGGARVVRVWDLLTGRERATHVVEDEGQFRDAGSGAWLTSDGANFTQQAADGSIQIWDTRTNRALVTLEGSGDTRPDYHGLPRLRWRPHGFSPDGSRLSASDGWDSFIPEKGGWVRVWDVTSGAALLTLRCHDGEVAAIAFSRDNAMFATAGFWDGTMRLWDGRTGTQVGGTDFAPSST